MSDELAEKIKNLKKEKKECDRKWSETYKLAMEYSRRADAIYIELESLMPEWLKTQLPIESWKYWVEKANEEGVRIYYTGNDIRLVGTSEWEDLDRDEKEELREYYNRATIKDTPDDETILAVVTECAEADEYFS